MAQASLVDRMIGAALLKESAYEAVERDDSATLAALVVVLLAAIASGIGSLGQTGIVGLVLGALFTVMGWGIYAGIAYIVGGRVLATAETRATWGELLRTLGFAQSPGILAVLGILPGVGGLLRFLVSIWILVTTVIAIRQACDFSTGRAIVTAIVAWIVYGLFVVFPAVVLRALVS